jgi:50S ribosome-binding GTPase
MPAEDAILIAVMGVTGAGNSQFINTLKASRINNDSSQTGQVQHGNYATVGKKLKSGESFEETEEILLYKIRLISITETRCIEFFHLQVDNRNVILIDTPGFNDKDRSDSEILQDLATWLTDTFARKHLLSGICYMHNITNTRFDATASENCVMLHKLMEIVMLVTSMWDKCQADPELEAEYVDHKKELKEDHWADLVEDGARMMRTYNNFESNMECIKSIIAKNPRRILALQYQICKEGRRLPATDPGAHVMKTAHSFELELGGKLADINKLEAQREQQNLAPSKTLAKQREKLEQDLADARRDQAKLESWTWRERNWRDCLCYRLWRIGRLFRCRHNCGDGGGWSYCRWLRCNGWNCTC